MVSFRILPLAVVGLLSAASVAYAQSDSIYGADPSLYPGFPNQTQTNAVVNSGSGAVKPLGPGQDRNTAGIGGSASAAPRGAAYDPRQDPSATGQVATSPVPVRRTHHATKHRTTQHG